MTHFSGFFKDYLFPNFLQNICFAYFQNKNYVFKAAWSPENQMASPYWQPLTLTRSCQHLFVFKFSQYDVIV